MDEEQCDLDELQALLEADEALSEENTGSQEVTVRSDKDKESASSIQEFLEGSSDSEDEASSLDTKHKSRTHPSGQSDDMELLASLMDDDDFDQMDSKAENSAVQRQTSGALRGKNERKTKTFSTSATTPSKHKRQHKTNSVNSKSPKEVKSDTIVSSQSTAVNSGSPNETEILRAEMARMQQQMLEMQKMLAQQQQTQQPAPQREDRKSGKVFLENQKKHPHKSSSGSAKKSPPGNVPEKRQITEKSFSLVPDCGDNLFFQSSPTTSKAAKCAKTSTSSSKTTPLPSQKSKSSKKDKMARELFGDSDSDWDDLDGEDKRTLSEAGKDIKRLINSGERRREAHQPKFSVSESPYPKNDSWSVNSSLDEESKPTPTTTDHQKKIDKNSLQCKSSSTEQKEAQSSSAIKVEEKYVVEDFSKIRIINPLVSSYMMRSRMDGRKMIGVSKIHLKLKTTDLQGDWVTIAVVVGRTEAKASKTGKPYSIWKLNNLEDLENSVSFFLFGEVHKTHWKLEVGTVVGVLNPTIMESMDRKNSEPAFTIKNPNQLMVMGRSKDLGWCKGRTKKGNKCSHFINTKFGEYCAYHVQAEYRRTSAKRLELHGSIAGIKPKSFEKKIFSKDCAYMYGGSTFVPNSTAANSKKSKKGLTLAKLQQTAPKGQVNTLIVQDIKPTPTKNHGNVKSASTPNTNKLMDDSDGLFADMVAVPSPGSMNLVAFLKNKEDKSVKASSSSKSSPKPGLYQSVTPKDLIKQHRLKIKEMQAEKQRAASASLGNSGNQKVDPLKQRPVLGKGFYSGQDIALDTKRSHVSAADRAKLKAIAAVQGKGGIKKEDPNAVKTAKDVGTIRKRLQDETEKHSSSEEGSSSSSSSQQPSTSSSSGSQQPPKKKSRLLGNVDLNSAEVKSILKARSKHQGALTEAELEREEAYFTALEKKEMLEEKMKSVTSIEVSLFTCKQCLYTAQHALDSCRKDGHEIKKSKAKKRFFACKKCKHRTSVVDGKFPTESCKKCGSTSYEKTSMYQEKSGPKLASETLSIRGDEVKYLNSLDQKVFLNTVVDD